MNEYEEIAKIARASLMPDFFAVRIDEEKLFARLQEMLAKIKLPTPLAQLETIKQLAAASGSSNSFIEEIKARKLWETLRDVLTKIRVS